MRARWTTILAVLAAGGLLMALPAGADQHDLDPADRALVHAYSGEAMRLLWATVMGDATAAETECGVTEGESYTYDVDQAGNVTIVEDPDGAATETVQTDGCEFHETDVRGPQGQVNHGTVVSNFVKALKEAGHEGGLGCYVKVIAGSDYGKGDDQIRVPDVDPDGDNGDDEATTVEDVEFTITETTCKGGGNDDDDSSVSTQSPGNGNGNGKPQGVGNGKPSWAGDGPPPHAKGGK